VSGSKSLPACADARAGQGIEFHQLYPGHTSLSNGGRRYRQVARRLLNVSALRLYTIWDKFVLRAQPTCPTGFLPLHPKTSFGSGANPGAKSRPRSAFTVSSVSVAPCLIDGFDCASFLIDDGYRVLGCRPMSTLSEFAN
jgi:hypothetical protein